MRAPNAVHHPPLVELKDVIDTLTNYFRREFTQTAKVINGSIGLGSPSNGVDNIDLVWATGTSPAGVNTEFEVVHNLGRIPVGFIPVNKDKAGDIYASTGGTAWTTQKLYLKCSVASLAYTLLIF